ncbi:MULTISPECIES: hypothetical protein [Cysteiniphilum]|uniref:MFS transporter n=1 Tax=Cysteiniphilum litorale TaxID=2056700 RepID=A0A8J3E8I7_9GAMM|nr:MULTISPECIES: hypothetical protein [Cysteiniphilum]GGF99051.1 hypothetical protein GCM10010995_15400 [Cysteiniphilum litorale]
MKLIKRPLFILLSMQFLFAIAYGMIYYSAYWYLFQNQPFTSTDILEILLHILAISGAIGVIASFIGKCIIDFKQLLYYSLIFQVVGCLLLAFNQYDLIRCGFAIYTVGYGFVVTCITILLDNYLMSINANENRTKIVFTWDILFFNGGMLVGCVIGLFVIDFGVLFIYGFLFCGLSLFVYLLGYNKITLYEKIRDKLFIRHLGIMAISAVLFLITLISFNKEWSFIGDSLIIISSIMLFTYFLVYMLRSNNLTKIKIRTFLHYLFYMIVFWSFYQLMPFLTSHILMFYSDNYFLGMEISLTSNGVGIINTMVITFFSLILPIIYKRVKVKYYISFQLSLLVMLISFSVMFYSTYVLSDLKIGLLFIISFVVLISLSEVLMVPLQYTIVKQVINTKDRVVFYSGVAFLLKSLSPVLSAQLFSGAVANIHKISTFSSFFFLICFALILCILLLKFYSSKRCIDV